MPAFRVEAQISRPILGYLLQGGDTIAVAPRAVEIRQQRVEWEE